MSLERARSALALCFAPQRLALYLHQISVVLFFSRSPVAAKQREPNNRVARTIEGGQRVVWNFLSS